MTEHTAARNPERRPTLPRELLLSTVLPATKLSKAEFARRLGVSRQSVYDLLEGRQRVSPEMAVRLGALFGNGPQLWYGMQSNCDLWDAARTVDTSAIRPLEPA